MNQKTKELLTAGGLVGLLFGLSSKKDEDGVELKLFEKKISFQDYKNNPNWDLERRGDRGSYIWVIFDQDKNDKEIFTITKAIAYDGNIDAKDITAIAPDGDCFNIQANGTHHAKFLVVKKVK